MKTTNEPISHGASAASTTEELIVQYLDGELVRRELEAVLFDRLSRSEEARALLREYLVLRGAIRQSREDERFQLSDDLDDRTRARIQKMLENAAAEEVPNTFLSEQGFLADRQAIATSPAGRRIQRWALRPSLATLALLLAVGTTWFLTHTSDRRAESKQAFANLPVATSPVTTEISEVSVPAVPAEVKEPNTVRTQPETKPLAASASSAIAQTIPQPKPTEQTATEMSDPADVMISHRYSKAIEGAAKHEVLISSRDRL